MKVTITKSPGNAEQISVEVDVDGLGQWKGTVEPILALLDLRLHEQNMRILRGAQESRSIDSQAADVAATILRAVNGVSLEEAVAKLEAAGIPV